MCSHVELCSCHGPDEGNQTSKPGKEHLCDPKVHSTGNIHWFCKHPKQCNSHECASKSFPVLTNSWIPGIQEDFILKSICPLLLFLLHKMGKTVGRGGMELSCRLWHAPAEAHQSTKKHMAAQRGLSPPDLGGGGVKCRALHRSLPEAGRRVNRVQSAHRRTWRQHVGDVAMCDRSLNENCPVRKYHVLKKCIKPAHFFE